MIKAAATWAKGWPDDAIGRPGNAARNPPRAGAGILLTYWAKDVAGWLAE